MKKAKIGELRNNLSRYLQRVREGETVTIYDRNLPIAEIVPIAKSRQQDDEDRLDRLERRGVIRRGRGDLRKWLRTHKPIKIPGVSLVETILKDRESGW
jgi:prevent-host-death family protein